NFATLPEVNLGQDTVFCGGGSITLDAGNQGSTYLWSNGATTQTIMVDSTGFGYGVLPVSVVVTTGYGCANSAEVSVEFKDCTSIDEKEAISLNIYPNPGNGIFNLELSSLVNQKVAIKIFNLNGALVYEESDVTVSNTGIHRLNLSILSTGVYQLNVIGKHASVSDKLVINK
ncbi:MAG: T9SS type A sorting domain-containing protein, partial [Bacteroidales bacterium]|nr:T9SS type A sorting domain-containing protein [Bacteroidales bacterium]